MTTDRRTFLRTAALLTAAASPLAPLVSYCADAPVKEKPRVRNGSVVIVRKPDLMQAPATALSETLFQMLGAGICRLTGSENPVAAWAGLFPKTAVIGIKVNAMGGPRICTHPELAYAVARHLTSAGVRAQNIIIWDRLSSELAKGGYALIKTEAGVQCYGTDTAYASSIEIAGSVGTCFSTIIAEQCDALINLPVLKDHDLSGVSLGLKNFYGAIHNPNKYHDNGCDPYIADLNAHPFIQNKLRLTIIDGLTAQYHGGPAYKPQWNQPYEGLILSRDPVAADRAGATIIDDLRKQNGLPALAECGRSPVHILTAAQRGLGSAAGNTIQTITL